MEYCNLNNLAISIIEHALTESYNRTTDVCDLNAIDRYFDDSLTTAAECAEVETDKQVDYALLYAEQIVGKLHQALKEFNATLHAEGVVCPKPSELTTGKIYRFNMKELKADNPEDAFIKAYNMIYKIKQDGDHIELF